MVHILAARLFELPSKACDRLWRVVDSTTAQSKVNTPQPTSLVGYKDDDIATLLEDGYPDLVIGSGRTTAPLSYLLKQASGGKTASVQIQHPR
jgi:hypothetical protein